MHELRRDETRINTARFGEHQVRLERFVTLLGGSVCLVIE